MAAANRDAGISALTDILTLAGVSPEDAARVAPNLIDNAGRTATGPTGIADQFDMALSEATLDRMREEAHDTASATARRDYLRDDHGRFSRDPDAGRVTEPIGDEGARGNSKPVTADEFQRYAARGQSRLRAIQQAPWSTGGLDANWARIKAETYAKVRQSWGGATIDPRTGRALPDGADKFAMSIKPTGLDTTSIPESATPAEFSQAMDIARSKYGRQLSKGGSYLGVFHDDDLNRIDIDPVTVLDNLDDVESIGAYTHAIGGAYRFSDGNGYWPPHVPSGASMSAEDGRWDGPGQWHSHAVVVQQPHDEPEDAAEDPAEDDSEAR